MIYLDYSATTPASKSVLEAYTASNQKYFANANSTHALGKDVDNVIKASSEKILKLFKTIKHEVIYTSGATEANNLAIKGVALKYKNVGKHLITSPYEHSSVVSCFNYLAKKGFQVDIVPTDEFGLIDLDELKSMITDETILVSIAAINSETGIKQDIAKIGDLLKEYKNCFFHSDMTQAIGKLKVDIGNVDLVSMSAHKFYGLKGIGALLKRTDIVLEPIIHGGKSTTVYRAGTPATPLILSLDLALEEAYYDFDSKYRYIKSLNEYLKTQLLLVENVHINSNQLSIPQIINVSFTDIAAHDLQDYLSKNYIYISTQTACASEKSFSETIKRLTGSDLYAETSVRISLSHMTAMSEIDVLIKKIKEAINK